MYSRNRLLWVTASLVLGLGCLGQGSEQIRGPEPVVSAPEVAEEPLRHPAEVHLADLRQLTHGGENAEAYWSFDGTQLIFQTTRPPFGCDQIMRMPIDGSAEPELVSTGTGRTTCAYFLPGDQEVVYSSTHHLGPECPPPPSHAQGYVWALYGYDIYKAGVDGSDPVNLTNRAGYDAEATVCPRDGSILFTSDRDGDLELYRMDRDGKNVVRLTSAPGYDGGAFFSQDCSKIVWRASRPQGAALDDYRRLLAQGLVRPGKLEIYIADSDGTNARQVTYLNAATFAPYLHPAGRRILFSTNYGDPSGREFDIWAVDIDGTNLERITHAPGFDGFPMFSHDGTMLAFSSNRNQKNAGDTDVYVARWIDAPADHDHRAMGRGAPERFRERVAWLADDAREGRGLGTQGLDEAANWIAAEMAALGVAGAADSQGAYKQAFDVPVELVRKDGTALVINGKEVDAAALVPSSYSSVAEISGQTVFAGYGIIAPELGVNDYKKVNARGKVVVVRRFTPTTKPFDSDDARRRYSEIQYKAFTAREQGAIGLIVVDAPADGEAEVPDAPLPELAPRGRDAGIPVVVLTRAAGKPLLKGQHRVRMSVALERKKKPVYNVVGKIAAAAADRLPGAVVIGAHYDHLGHGDDSSLEPDRKVIHNGADDNASGVAALLEVAGVLAEARQSLRRDVYLVAFTAEETGLLGSAHFVANLPEGLAAPDIAAMLNMDMVGRMRDNQIYVLGAQSALEWGDLVQPACAEQRVQCGMSGDGYGPSDQMSFYMAGVPVLHFFTGGHLDYHKSSDDAEHINAAGGARVAAVVAAVGRDAASRDARLTYQRTTMPAPRGDVRAAGASLGTIPAYGDSSDAPGMLLGDVRPDGPAHRAGLRAGDRIIRVDGSEIRSVRDLMYVLRQATPGQKARVTVLRDGKELTVEAVYAPPSRRM